MRPAPVKAAPAWLLATSMTVFIQTDRFVPGDYYGDAAFFRIEPTQDTLALIQDALRGIRSICKPRLEKLEGRRLAQWADRRDDRA